MAVMIDKETKEAAPVTAFLTWTRWPRIWPRSTTPPAASGSRSSASALALLRNYDPFQAPTHFKITDMMKKMDKTFNATGKNYGSVKGDRTMEDIKKRRQDRWNFLFIAGMWFQDLFNYDFRRTEQCIIPYATQEGEISFCAYNTGVGWRNIIEKMHMTATLTKWYEEHGRHEIFAGGKKVGMNHVGHELKLNMEHVNAEANHTLDNLGIAKNAREEKIRARDEKMKQEAENARWPSSIASTSWARSRSRDWFRSTDIDPSNNPPAHQPAKTGRRTGRRRLRLAVQAKFTGNLGSLKHKGRPRLRTAFVFSLVILSEVWPEIQDKRSRRICGCFDPTRTKNSPRSVVRTERFILRLDVCVLCKDACLRTVQTIIFFAQLCPRLCVYTRNGRSTETVHWGDEAQMKNNKSNYHSWRSAFCGASCSRRRPTPTSPCCNAPQAAPAQPGNSPHLRPRPAGRASGQEARAQQRSGGADQAHPR